ncbi:MAG: 3-dehydroquinate synthase [Oscillospiraceae bacterium]|nr:3-dehydroquinate synthase [Oscillospiraceae bacterium]
MEPRTCQVELGENSYEIRIGEGVLDSAGAEIRSIYTGKKALVLTDENVYALYGGRLQAALAGVGIRPVFKIVPPGEGHKTMQTLAEILSALAGGGFTREELLIAFGGGVPGDMGGFAAACYMRGIRYVQIPTTLLAQVDSSVGGKTGVDLPEGKNLAGAFWQPRLVLADTDVLATLDDRQFASGMAEVIKYGCIFSKELFGLLEEYPDREKLQKKLPDVICRCCELKRDVVQRDEKETGERMLLNFGHTFGHAIEKLGGYETHTHGEGVAMGMVLAAHTGERLGLHGPKEAERIAALCQSFGLPVKPPYPVTEIPKLAAIDKKAEADGVKLILLNGLGKAGVYPMPLPRFEALMQEVEQG